MRYTQQRNPDHRGRVEVTAGGAIVRFSNGKLFSLSAEQLHEVLSLKRGSTLRTRTLAIYRRRRDTRLDTVLGIPASDSGLRILVTAEGPMKGWIMIISRRGLQRGARLVAQEQA